MNQKIGRIVLIYLSVCLLVIPFAESENIVFFFGVSSYSHRIPGINTNYFSLFWLN